MLRRLQNRPFTTVVLAVSADGKIADSNHSAARFGSLNDKRHLENQVAQTDAVLFGAGTLRAYGSALRVVQPELLQQRHYKGKPAQPAQIVCSRSAQLNPAYRFFEQPIPRWLLTTSHGALQWQDRQNFEQVLVAETTTGQLDWVAAFRQLAALNIQHLTVLGGGTLVASLLAAGLIDEIWFTICPILLGGATAPTPVEGTGFLEAAAPRLELLEVRSLDQEVFLHYRVLREPE